MLKKTSKPNVFKDTKTGALINKDMNRLTAYKKQKQILEEARASKKEMDDMKETVSDLKTDIHNLMDAVTKLSSKMDHH